MRPKEMEDLVAFSAIEVKKAVAEEREKETNIPLQKDRDSQSKNKVIHRAFPKLKKGGSF